jgi:serine palmitoyltransferase
VLQDVVDEVLAERRLRGYELIEARASIRFSVTAALSCKQCERAAGIIKAAVTNVLANECAYCGALPI